MREIESNDNFYRTNDDILSTITWFEIFVVEIGKYNGTEKCGILSALGIFLGWV